MGEKVPLTEAQVLRQVNRIKRVLFADYSENEDGTYEGEIVEPVLEIIQSVLTTQREVSEIDFLKMISEATKQLVRYLNEQLKSVDERVVNFFAFDFVTQTMDFMYSINMSRINDDYDPMFS